MKFVPRQLLADRLVLLALALHLVAAAILATAAAAPGSAAATAETIVHPLLLALTFSLLLVGHSKASEQRERLFWRALAAAWLCWLVVEYLFFVELPLPLVSASFATDLLYILFFLFVALAVELKPHLPLRFGLGLRRRLESVAGLLAVFGLLIYFGLVNLPEPLGLSINFVSRERGLVPFLLVRVSLELMLAGRLTYAAQTAARGRWPGTYLFLAFAFLGFAVRHSSLVLQQQHLMPEALLGPTWRLATYLPELMVILAARYRFLPGKGPVETEEIASQDRDEVFRTSPLALYILAVPVAHFGLYPLGLLDESAREPREIFSLVYLLMISIIAALHQVVIERERRLAVAALEAEIKRRRRINRELEARQAEMEQFSYTISHELKAPLVTIIGFAGFIEREVGSRGGQIQSDLGKIHKAATDMRELLGELLELSRVGWVIQRTESISMSSVAESARDKVLVAGDRAEATVLIDPTMPVVKGDPARLEDVFKNLITNAIKFTEPHQPVEVEIGCRLDPGPVFYVSDSGLGVDPRYHDRIFGLFDRVHPKIEGTGVGLALVKRIVEKHGGEVWVESEGEGLGSTFCFTIPGVDTDSSEIPTLTH